MCIAMRITIHMSMDEGMDMRMKIYVHIYILVFMLIYKSMCMNMSINIIKQMNMHKLMNTQIPVAMMICVSHVSISFRQTLPI